MATATTAGGSHSIPPDRLSARLPRALTANPGRAFDLAVVALIALYVVVLMPGLTRWPPLINDEGREANLFWAAARVDPTAERMNAHRGFSTWGNGGLQGATAALIFRLFGLGVFQLRLTSLLWGGLVLLLIYWVGRRYWNRRVGLAAAALMAISNPFLVATHTLRPDIQVVAIVLGALLLAERALDSARRRPLVYAFLSGLLLVLVVDTHPNGIAFFPLVGLAFLLRLGWRDLLRRPVFWAFFGGGVAAVGYYLLIRFVPDPAGFVGGLSYWVGVDKAPPAARATGGIAAKLAAMVTNEIARYQDYFGEEPLELAVVLVGLAGGLWMAVRGSYPARLIWLGLLFAGAFFIVAVSTKSKYYMLLTYPLYMLLLARVLERAAVWIVGRTSLAQPHEAVSPAPTAGTPVVAASWLPAAASAALLALLVGGVAIWPMKLEDRAWDNYIQARRYRAGQEYTQLTSQLKELAGPGARILAPPLYWVGMSEHPFVDVYVYERLERTDGMSAAQFLDEVRPDFVITDAKIATDRRIERLLYNELDRRATYELVVRHKNYGDVAIYRLRQQTPAGR
ncbi:MAG: glycosyltransferase family 39 protein [Chloroflexi bacterium]|nr:glycosyltransferase family 39 protein [Chloroflexota bacterium]